MVTHRNSDPNTMSETNFANIVGQDLAVKVLKRSITSDTVSHAYLFVGVEGVGKCMTALAFAAALNCESASGGEPCGECWSCRAIPEGRHPDVELIAPETEQTKIEQMREMRRRAMLRPVRSPWKVIIIERADTLNEDSASAILKILEEPPSYAVLLLLTRNLPSTLPTIVSRCQVVRFRQAAVDTLKTVLHGRFGADEEKADFLARYSEGRPGVAISLLQDDGFFARREAILAIARRAETVSKVFALRLAEDFRKACARPAPTKSGPVAKTAGKTKTAPQESESDEDSGPDEKAKTGRRDILLGLAPLVLWYRDLLSLSISGPDAPLINVDKKAELSESVANADTRYLRSALGSLNWAKRAIEGNANAQLITEVVMMRLLKG